MRATASFSTGVVGLSFVLAVACGGSSPLVGDGGLVFDDGPPHDAGPPVPARTLRFDALAHFADPIADYIDFYQRDRGNLDFNRALDALFVFDDRMYVGYGDADLNLGRKRPIEIRAFIAPDQPPRVEGLTAEEEIQRYRRCGAILCIPGTDATEDMLTGNVYLRDVPLPRGGLGWRKVRGIPHALHVHDMTSWRGALYASGSGAPSDADYAALKFHAYLWRSRDQGTTWEVAAEVAHADSGDIRFTHLLPQDDGLYAFGFRNHDGLTVELLHQRFDGSVLAPLPQETLQGMLLQGTWALSGARGLLRGLDTAARPQRYRSWLFERGVATELAGELADMRLVSAAPQDDGSILLLAYVGSQRQRGTPAPDFDVRVFLTDDFVTLRPLTQATMSGDAGPRSLEYWRSSVFVGDAAGVLWRAVGAPASN